MDAKQYCLNMLRKGTYEYAKYDTLKEMIEDSALLYHMEDDLTSKYVDGKYLPAVTYMDGPHTTHFWLFDGEIKDYDHPFCVSLENDGEGTYFIVSIVYYSTDRVINNMPIEIFNSGRKHYNLYDHYNPIIMIDGYRSWIQEPDQSDIYETANIKPREISPECEEFHEYSSYEYSSYEYNGFKLKFVD